MYNFVPIYLYINSCSHSSHLHGNDFLWKYKFKDN